MMQQLDSCRVVCAHVKFFYCLLKCHTLAARLLDDANVFQPGSHTNLCGDVLLEELVLLLGNRKKSH